MHKRAKRPQQMRQNHDALDVPDAL